MRAVLVAAHNIRAAAILLKRAIVSELGRILRTPADRLVNARIQRYRAIGRAFRWPTLEAGTERRKWSAKAQEVRVTPRRIWRASSNVRRCTTAPEPSSTSR